MTNEEAHYISYITNYPPFDNSHEYITKCSNCGCGLYDTAFYCPICGVKINERVVRSRNNGIIIYPSWIPVSEKNPDNRGFYLVSTTDCITIMEFVNGWISQNIGLCNNYVKAWMPLPEPYMEEEG